jgi:cell division protease FtsH
VKKLPGSRVLLFVLIAIVALVAVNSLWGGEEERRKLSLAQFQRELAGENVRSAEITESDGGGTIIGELGNGSKFTVDYPPSYGEKITDQALAKVENVTFEKDQENVWLSLFMTFLPVILLVGLFLFIVNHMQGGGNRVMQFGKAKTKQVSKDAPKVTFADVAGADEAVQELYEIKEFLEPARHR